VGSSVYPVAGESRTYPACRRSSAALIGSGCALTSVDQFVPIGEVTAYNAEMNSRLYTAASRLTDSERRADWGAFFRSIHGTLVHLLWGDRTWMSRFDGWLKPAMGAKDSPSMIDDFDELSEQRVKADRDMQDWAGRVTREWLEENMIWFSDALQREMRTPRGVLVMHLLKRPSQTWGVYAARRNGGQARLPATA
jgi:uncharacterized damage-inducible protein DinB